MNPNYPEFIIFKTLVDYGCEITFADSVSKAIAENLKRNYEPILE